MGEKQKWTLSEKYIVEVSRQGFVWRQEYMRGEPLAPVEKGETTDKTGTKTTFWPDPEIFTETTVIDKDVIANLLQIAINCITTSGGEINDTLCQSQI